MKVTTKQAPPTTWSWTGYGFKAMNTTVQLWLYGEYPAEPFAAGPGEILIDIQRMFASFEKRLSRFDPDSELSRLNRSEAEVFKASPVLMDALEVALLAAEATGGLYDPTMLTALERAGYDRSFEKIARAAPLDLFPPMAVEVSLPAPAPFSARHAIQLNRARREIYRPAGVRVDLGGMGKGWTVDRTADRLQGLGPFLVNAGGDIFAYQAPPGQKGWAVDLVHPLKPAQFMARLYLQHQALATSTIAKRRWQQNGRLMHHLIDPRTGRPAQTDALSVSVVADRTVVAEIYAKSALILGADAGLAYLEGLPGIEGLIYTAGSKVLMTSGLSALLERVEPAGYPAGQEG